MLCSLPLFLHGQLSVGVQAPELTIDEAYQNGPAPVPTLEKSEGKIVVLTFWATWCKPCLASFPDYSELYRQFENEDVQFVALADDPEDRLENFLAERKVDFLVGRDAGDDDFDTYQVTSIPQVFIINRSGKIIYEGSHVSAEMVNEALERDQINVEAYQPQQVQTMPLSQPEGFEVITWGNFGIGGDPVMQGMKEMIARASGSDEVDRSNAIYQFTIRPSLETEYGGHGYRTTAEGKIGITYSGGTLPDLMAFLRELPSPVRVQNRTGHSGRYDLIYWKQAESLQAAYAELEKQMLLNMNLSVQVKDSMQAAQVLSVGQPTDRFKKKEDIKPGTQNLYTPLSDFITILESKSGTLHVLDPAISGLYLYTQDEPLGYLPRVTYPEVVSYLEKNGIVFSEKEVSVPIHILSKK